MTNQNDRQGKIDNCHSYNGDFGEVSEVILKMPTSVLPNGERHYKDVAIDYCIAPAIKHLWDNGVTTHGSCCGHGKQPPSIVLGDGVDDYRRVRKIIKEKDGRQYGLTQWKRVIV